MVQIRPVSIEDVEVLKSLIDEMAEFERLPVTITAGDLATDGFGARPLFRALVAEVDGAAAGYVLFHPCYTSFQGKAIFLEDIYVAPRARGLDIGQKLLAHVATTALAERCFGIVFNVLKWNSNAFAFFGHAGAQRLDDWAVLTLTGDALRATAAGA